jgi:hypothetical protein
MPRRKKHVLKFPVAINRDVDLTTHYRPKVKIPRAAMDALENPDIIKFVIEGQRVSLEAGGNLSDDAYEMLDFITKHPGCTMGMIRASVKIDRNRFHEAFLQLRRCALIDMGEYSPMKVYKGREDPQTWYPAIY